MDAIEFILSEHEQIRKFIQKINSEEDSNKLWDLFEKIKPILLRHEKMEEELFYPTLKKQGNFNEIIDHLIGEEKKAEKVIKKLNDGKVDADWKKDFKKLANDVDHHANDEETKLFPKVKKEVSQKILDSLGIDLRNFSEKAKK